MYMLSLEIGVFGGFITPAFSYIHILPVNQVETLALPCFVLVCVGLYRRFELSHLGCLGSSGSRASA